MSSVVQLLRQEQRDLYVSASALRTLESCPREHWYKYIEGRPAQDVPGRLILGSAMHKSLALFYRCLRDGEAEPTLDTLVSVAGASIGQAVASKPPILFGAGEDPASLVTEASRVLGVFLEQGYRPDRIVGVELPFSLPLVHPVTGEVLGYEEQLVGAMDLVVEEAGTIVVVDHKVVGRADKTKAERADLQMSLYAWAARQLFDADDVGLRYHNIVRTKTAKVQLQDIARVANDEVEGVEAAASGLAMIHAAVGRQDGKRLMGRRRSWRCKEYGLRETSRPARRPQRSPIVSPPPTERKCIAGTGRRRRMSWPRLPCLRPPHYPRR